VFIVHSYFKMFLSNVLRCSYGSVIGSGLKTVLKVILSGVYEILRRKPKL